jgi:hypothetical protein
MSEKCEMIDTLTMHYDGMVQIGGINLTESKSGAYLVFHVKLPQLHYICHEKLYRQ